MASIDQDSMTNDLNSLHELSVSSSDSDDDDDNALPSPSSHNVGTGIDIDSIKSAKKIEHTVAHQVEAERSILALVVDEDFLFAGLEGGDITVCRISYVFSLKQILGKKTTSLLADCRRQVWSLETFEKVFTVHAHAESVLCLSLSEDKQLLFSSGVDSVVNVRLDLLCFVLTLNKSGLVCSKSSKTLFYPFSS